MTSTTRGAVGAALVLLVANGAVWAERAAAWLDDPAALVEDGKRAERAGPAAVERAPQLDEPQAPVSVARHGATAASPQPQASVTAAGRPGTKRAARGGSLDLQRIVRAVEERHEAPPPKHPVAATVHYGEAGAEFGAQRAGHAHEGQDIFAPAGTPLVAVRDGVVVDAGTDAGRGNHIAIYSEEADQTYVYFHMLAPAEVAIGDRVEAGTKLGELGCTGSCHGDHLHFELHAGEGAEAPAVDPMPLLERLTR